MSGQTTVVLTCDASVADELRRVLADGGADVQAYSQRQLDGSAAASWVFLATVAIRPTPALLDSLRAFLTRNHVGKVTVGDVTITSPRPEDVDTLLEIVRQRQS